MNNSIYIRRKKKVLLEKEQNILTDDYLITLLVNMESLGFTITPELADQVKKLSVDSFKHFYNQLIMDLKENVGAYVEFKPMYPNFPEQVQRASMEELSANAFWHYLGDWAGLRIIPHYEKKERKHLQDEVRLKAIGLGHLQDFESIFTRLIHSKTSLSATDKQDLAWFIATYRIRIYDLTPAEIPHKENLAYYLACLLKNEVEQSAEKLLASVKTATDILRIATALSEGDVSLAENTKFITFSKRIRKLFLSALEKMDSLPEDMLRYPNRWKRLGEKLHPLSYPKRYPKCCEAFDIIRNDKPYETFNSQIEKGLINGDLKGLLTYLRLRPGELARRLDKLIRLTAQPQEVIDTYRDIAGKVSTPVLLQLLAHFKNRNHPRELRTFFPKGEIGKARAVDYNLPFLSPSVCIDIVHITEEALIMRFKDYKPLGKVYLDDQLKNYTVPLAMRAASKALKTLSRGSKIDLPFGNTLRFFIYWKDGSGRTDLDLSALALDAASAYKMTIAYYNLKDLGGCHSGDITSAPDGASEFIDIDMDICLKQDIRYILMCVHSFTNQSYSDLPICFAGFMMRQHANSGEIYEPLTISQKFDLTAGSRVAIPFIIDLLERKVIWVDLSLKGNPSAVNNVHHNLSSLTIINKSMTTLTKPILYDLLDLHIKARGERTFDIQEANTIFAIDQGITPSDIDIIVSDFL